MGISSSRSSSPAGPGVRGTSTGVTATGEFQAPRATCFGVSAFVSGQLAWTKLQKLQTEKPHEVFARGQLSCPLWQGSSLATTRGAWRPKQLLKIRSQYWMQ